MSSMILFFALIGLISGQIVLRDFRRNALAQHNLVRQLHCTGPLILNETLNTIAQTYAQNLATKNISQHSGYPGLGENLYTGWQSSGFTTFNGSIPTLAWYKEIAFYDYSKPGFSMKAGHFTQVVWANSAQLGIGIALNSAGTKVYVVANYFPAGNVGSGYVTNVRPLCTGTTMSTATIRTTSASSATSSVRPISSTSSTRPASRTSSTRPASSTSSTRPASSTSSPRPASSTSSTRPASSTSSTRPVSSTSSTRPASSTVSTRPASSTLFTRPVSSTSSTRPASSTLSTRPVSTTSSTRPPSRSAMTSAQRM